MFQNLCRLCLGTHELLWIFDEKISDNMMEIIEVTSGVEICKTDSITQLVCSTCCQLTIKMYKFRTTAIRNDKDLKARCAGYNITQLTNAAALTFMSKMEGRPPSATCPSFHETSSSMFPPSPPILPQNHPMGTPSPPIVPQNPPISASIVRSRKFTSPHPSVMEVLRKNPNIKLPQHCLKANVRANVKLDRDEVDQWFRTRNLTNREIENLKQESCEIANTPSRYLEKTPQMSPEVEPIKRKRGRPPQNRESGFKITIIDNKRVKLSDECYEKLSKLKSDNPENSSIFKKISSPESVRCDLNVSDRSVKNEVNKNISATIDAVVNNNDDVIGRKIRYKSVRLSSGSDSTHRRWSASSDNSVKSKGDSGTAVKLKVGVQVKSVSVFDSLLATDHSNTKNLTPLKSELSVKTAGAKASNFDENESDVDDPPPACSFGAPSDNESAEEHQDNVPKITKQKKHLLEFSVSEEDLLFTSRPFVKQPVVQKKTPSSSVLIVSDSEDEERVAEQIRSSSSTSNVSIISGSTSDSTSVASSSVQCKTSQISNMPDLSLVSFANRTKTLFTCKVCDSQHKSVKDVKHHTRKTHTKCPFCRKRFRSSANRDEHLESCSIKNASAVLKKMKIQLVRVDEVEEIRNKYQSAFEREGSTDQVEVENISKAKEGQSLPQVQTAPEVQAASEDKTETNVQAATVVQASTIVQAATEVQRVSELETATKVPKRGYVSKKPRLLVQSAVDCDPATEVAVDELEKFLNFTEVVASKGRKKVNSARRRRKQVLAKSRDEPIISISDDECEPIKANAQQEGNQENVDVVTYNTSSDIISIQQESSQQEIDVVTSNISNDFIPTHQENSQQKINIVGSSILNNSNIYEDDVNVLTAIILGTLNKKRNDLQNGKAESNNVNLDDNPILEGYNDRVKIFKDLRKELFKHKIPVEISYNPTITVGYKRNEIAKLKKGDVLWHTMKPTDLKPSLGVPVIPASPPPSASLISILKDRQALNVSRRNSLTDSSLVTFTNDKHGTVSTTNLAMPPCSLMTTCSNVAVSLLPTEVSNAQITTVKTTETWSNLALSLPGTMEVNNAQIPIVNTTETCRNVPIAPESTGMTLPAIQGPLPVIQSVTSAAGSTDSSSFLEEPAMTIESSASLVPESDADSTIMASGAVVHVNGTVLEQQKTDVVADSITEVAPAAVHVDDSGLRQETSVTENVASTNQPVIRVKLPEELTNQPVIRVKNPEELTNQPVIRVKNPKALFNIYEELNC